MFLYLPVEQSLRSAHLGAYRSFGIAAFECTVQGNRQVAFLPDVSPDEGKAALIACRCTSGQVELVHLQCVVEDLL